MSFVVFADGTANLPGRLLDGIKLLPIAYTVNGVPDTYNGDIEDFDEHALNRCSKKETILSILP